MGVSLWLEPSRRNKNKLSKMKLAFVALCLVVAVQASTLPEVQEDEFALPQTIAEKPDLGEILGLGEIEGLGSCNKHGCCNCSRQVGGKCAAVGAKACIKGKCQCSKHLGVCIGNCK